MKSRVWWVVFFLVVIALAWSWFRGRKRDDGETKPDAARDGLLHDRVWVDSKPQVDTDHVHGFLALSYVPIGLVTRASAYEVELQVFHQAGGKDGTIHLVFPQTDREETVRYTVSDCSDLPPFDLCLDLDRDPWGGPTRFYGLRDEDAEEKHLGPLRRRMLAALPE
jgi:hypothetical protein